MLPRFFAELEIRQKRSFVVHALHKQSRVRAADDREYPTWNSSADLIFLVADQQVQRLFGLLGEKRGRAARHRAANGKGGAPRFWIKDDKVFIKGPKGAAAATNRSRENPPGEIQATRERAKEQFDERRHRRRQPDRAGKPDAIGQHWKPTPAERQQHRTGVDAHESDQPNDTRESNILTSRGKWPISCSLGFR